jgi:hypothetical protein
MNVAFVWLGNPVTLRFTLPLKPLVEVRLMVYVALPPRISVLVGGLTLRVKSGTLVAVWVGVGKPVGLGLGLGLGAGVAPAVEVHKKAPATIPKLLLMAVSSSSG